MADDILSPSEFEPGIGWRFERVRCLGCAVCGFQYSDWHHLFGRSSPYQSTLALCPNHHRLATITQGWINFGYPEEELNYWADNCDAVDVAYRKRAHPVILMAAVAVRDNFEGFDYEAFKREMAKRNFYPRPAKIHPSGYWDLDPDRGR